MSVSEDNSFRVWENVIQPTEEMMETDEESLLVTTSAAQLEAMETNTELLDVYKL